MSKIETDKLNDIILGSLRSVPENRDYGSINLCIVMEEFGEAIQMISKYLRGKDVKGSLTQELADAYLGIEYTKVICGISDDEFADAVNDKIYRQKHRNEYGWE